MNNYAIVFTRRAQKSLDALPDLVIIQILNSIKKLADNPRPNGSKKLTGREGYRIRVGDYRIIYRILDEVLVIEVIDIGHRKEIYG